MTSVLTIDDPSFTSQTLDAFTSSSKNSQMSSSDDPTMTSTVPKSLAAIMERMKKRQADAPADAPAPKKAYTGNLRFDLKCVIISAYNRDKSERFTVIPCIDQGEMIKNDRCNGYVDENVVRVRPDKEEDYSESITLGEVFEVSRWHGGKPERTPRKYKFGDSVILKRVSIKRGDNGMNFNNVHWVEHSEEKFQMNIPKTMMDLDGESYHKAIMVGNGSDVMALWDDYKDADDNSMRLKLTGNGKIYARMNFTYGEEGQGSVMFWQESLYQFGIYNPEVLNDVLPKVLTDTTITIIGNKEKDKEGYTSDKLKMNIRALLLGAGTLHQYVEEYGTSMTKAKVSKELGATVNSDLNEGHPLNSQPDTTILNLNEWSGSIKDMPSSTKFYKMWDTVIFAMLA